VLLDEGEIINSTAVNRINQAVEAVEWIARAEQIILNKVKKLFPDGRS
jgi:hypothetical protein